MSLGETASSTSCSDCNQAFQELNTFFHVLILLCLSYIRNTILVY